MPARAQLRDDLPAAVDPVADGQAEPVKEAIHQRRVVRPLCFDRGHRIGPRPPAILLEIPVVEPDLVEQRIDRRVIAQRVPEGRARIPADQDIADIENDHHLLPCFTFPEILVLSRRH